MSESTSGRVQARSTDCNLGVGGQCPDVTHYEGCLVLAAWRAAHAALVGHADGEVCGYCTLEDDDV